MRNSFERWLPADVGERIDVVLSILAIIVLTFDLVVVVLNLVVVVLRETG